MAIPPNSVQTDLNTAAQVYTTRFIEVVGGELEQLRDFSLNFSDAFMNTPGEALPVPLVSGNTVGDWDDATNNFIRQKVTLADILVTINQHKIVGFKLTREHLATFTPSYWQVMARLDAKNLAQKVITHVYGLVTAANFGDTANDKTEVSLATFNKSTIAQLRAQLVKRKMIPADTAIILNPDYFAALLDGLDASLYGGREAIMGGRIPGLFGFRSIIEAPNYTAGPGFAAHASALAVAGRRLMPLNTQIFDAFETYSDENTGMPFMSVIATNVDTGMTSLSTSCNFGAAPGDKKALVRLVEPTPPVTPPG